MKKILISLVLVLLTLCLFVSCCDEEEGNRVIFKEYSDKTTVIKEIIIPTTYTTWGDLAGVSIDGWTFNNSVTVVSSYGILFKGDSGLSVSEPIMNDSIIYVLH